MQSRCWLQEEVDRLGIEGVVEANHLHNELVDMRRSDLHSEMRKLMEDIAKTEALLKEAHAALAQKEEDKQELVQMRNALEDKLASDDGDDPDVVTFRMFAVPCIERGCDSTDHHSIYCEGRDACRGIPHRRQDCDGERIL